MLGLRIFILSLLPLGLLAGTPTPVTTVVIIGTSFSPGTVNINTGDTVRWTNSTGVSHNVTPNGNTDPTGLAPSGSWVYEFTFNTPGTFPYRCQIHAVCCGMTGIVNVASPTITPTITPSPSVTDTITSGPSPTITETFTISPTFSPSPTLTATPTISPTSTPGSPVIQIFDQAPDLLLAPNPQQIGQSICLYSNFQPAEAHWDIYNTALERVTHLDFDGSGQQCWDTKALAPGLYYVDVEWILPDASVKRAKQKVVLTR
jgi:plastocyanin